VRALRDLIVQQVDSVARTALGFMRDPMGGIRQAQELADSMMVLNESMQRTAIATPWNNVVTQDRSVAWVKFPFDDFRAMRQAFGGTINDLVLTLVSEAAARYLKHHGWAYGRLLAYRLPGQCPASRRADHPGKSRLNHDADDAGAPDGPH
jgi:wax ester synthase-like acyl-CoA acyltransferase family protein